MLTDSEWALTVGALRKRAGITGGTETLPTTVDSYLQRTFYPDVTSPVLLEIRRERTIELIAEGHRSTTWYAGKREKCSNRSSRACISRRA